MGRVGQEFGGIVKTGGLWEKCAGSTARSLAIFTIFAFQTIHFVTSVWVREDPAITGCPDQPITNPCAPVARRDTSTSRHCRTRG